MNQGRLRRQLPGRKPPLRAQRLWRSSSAGHGLAPIRAEGIVRAMISARVARVATSAGSVFLCSCMVLSSSFFTFCCFCVTSSLSHYTPSLLCGLQVEPEVLGLSARVCVFACSLLDLVGFWKWMSLAHPYPQGPHPYLHEIPGSFGRWLTTSTCTGRPWYGHLWGPTWLSDLAALSPVVTMAFYTKSWSMMTDLEPRETLYDLYILFIYCKNHI